MYGRAKPSVKAPRAPKNGPPPPALIRVNLNSRVSLAACNMPAVKGGGLFVPEVPDLPAYRLGDTVCLLVSLMNAPAIPVMGKVVWITPLGAVGHRLPGLGVRFADDLQAQRLRESIAMWLGDDAWPGGLTPHSHTFMVQGLSAARA